MPNILKISLTVILHLWEYGGDKKFKITHIDRKYRINIGSKLLASDLSKIWYESAVELVRVFHEFEKKQFGRESPIDYYSERERDIKMQEIVQWYYHGGNSLEN